MLLTELLATDRYGAFADYITVEEAKAVGSIHEPWHEFYPNLCKCGSEIIISRNLKRCTCCDPFCYLKVGKLMYNMLQRFECKHVGVKTCVSLAKHAFERGELKGHITLMLKAGTYHLERFEGAMKQHFFTALSAIQSKKLPFSIMMKNIAIPSFGSESIEIFEGINGARDLLEKLKEKGGVRPFLSEKGIYDPMRLFFLEKYLQEIIDAELFLFINKVPEGKIKVEVTLTGHLTFRGESITKEKYLQACMSLGEINNIRMFQIVDNDAVKSNAYIIHSEKTSKADIGLRRQAEARRYSPDIKYVWTPDEFYAHLEEWVAPFRDKYLNGKEEEVVPVNE